MPLSDLQQTVYDHCGHLQQDAALIRRILRNLNTAHRAILSKKGMSRLRRATLTFSSVADTPYAVLPQSVSLIQSITDRTNQQPISVFNSIQEVREYDPGLAFSSGVPTAALIDNLAAALKVEPSNASELFFKSDSASDGSSKEMFIQGIITGGEMRTASAAMNGTTAVSFSSSITSWISAVKVFLALAAGGATTAAGNITIHEDSGAGTELGRILPGRTITRYSRIQLFPVPTAVVTYHADVELAIIDMAEAGDEPMLPEDFHWLLESYAISREWYRKEKPALAREEERRYRDGIADLNSRIRKLAGRPLPLDGRPGFSQLGAYFEAGT
jgi:hypothetical protein